MKKEQLKQLENDLWSAADNLRANSDLKSSEYSTPVLGLIFLKFADNNYQRHETEILAEYQKLKGTRREKKLSDIAIEKCGFYLPDHARYEYLLNLPEEKDIAKALKEAMTAIEQYKPELESVLPKDEYFRLTRDEKTKNIPNQLLKNFADIPAEFTGDLFGQIYEYFLAEFARSEGSKGGEFFTPRSVVRLMVEIIEPHGGKVFDPACGSGGMFVQSAHFIQNHRKELKDADSDVFVCGQEKTLETVNLAKMNLAVNGLRGEIKKANIGLCKLASPAEVREQEYSLNPGRYVGVVIEEDGKTEEEFAQDLATFKDELAQLRSDASSLETVIATNLSTLMGE